MPLYRNPLVVLVKPVRIVRDPLVLVPLPPLAPLELLPRMAHSEPIKPNNKYCLHLKSHVL